MKHHGASSARPAGTRGRYVPQRTAEEHGGRRRLYFLPGEQAQTPNRTAHSTRVAHTLHTPLSQQTGTQTVIARERNCPCQASGQPPPAGPSVFSHAQDCRHPNDAFVLNRAEVLLLKGNSPELCGKVALSTAMFAPQWFPPPMSALDRVAGTHKRSLSATSVVEKPVDTRRPSFQKSGL